MRRPVIAGNWKMHKTKEEVEAFNKAFLKNLEVLSGRNSEIVLFPPHLYIEQVSKEINGYDHFNCGGQDCHEKDEGAFTGDISPKMIADAGGNYVIIGHSERRAYHVETNEQLRNKVLAALRNGLTPVYCCGESKADRDNGRQEEVVKQQVTEGLPSDIDKLVVAYEPVWAIGTGETATPEQAQEMHAFIRNQLNQHLEHTKGTEVPIIYGGSVKPDNANALFSCEDIDGALAGGSSLDPEKFFAILNEMEKIYTFQVHK